MELVVEIYNLTSNLPREEVYGITSQLRRAAVSIPSNIAEGHRRGSSSKDFMRFLRIAYGSGAELETQVEIIKRLNLVSYTQTKETEDLLLQVMKMLNKFLRT
jgi:four helix bundle protein